MRFSLQSAINAATKQLPSGSTPRARLWLVLPTSSSGHLAYMVHNFQDLLARWPEFQRIANLRPQRVTKMNLPIPSCILGLDIVWLVMASALSYALRYRHFAFYPPPAYSVLVLAAAGVWVLLLKTLPLDCFNGGWRFHVMLSRIVRATGLLMVFVLAFAYLTKLYYSRLLLIYFCVASTGGDIQKRWFWWATNVSRASALSKSSDIPSSSTKWLACCIPWGIARPRTLL